MKLNKDSSIIICSIVRNAEKGLKRNIPQINALCKQFKDYRVFAYENDSTDKTKTILEDWQQSDPQHIVVSLNTTTSERTIPSASKVGGVNPFYSHKRIDKMARLRNSYMEFIDKEGWESDYLMVVDLDVAWIQADNILTSFEKKDWDAVTAFGFSLSPRLKRRYHDTYALTEFGDENNPQTELKTKLLANKYANLRRNNEWVRVFSAFGGLAIYRFECVKGLRYLALDNEDRKVEVKCEHYSIYKQMSERGFNRVFINPRMELKYQDLTFEIAWNSLVRMLQKLVSGGVIVSDLELCPCVAFMVEPDYRCAA